MCNHEHYGWLNVFVRVGLNACTHPLEYGKILIQIGHEPLPPYKSRTIFGQEKLFYSSIFSYLAHIKRTDGFFGCYRGLLPRLSGNVVSGLAFQKVTDSIEVKNDDKEAEDLTHEQLTMRFINRTSRETLGRCAAIIASQPLNVIAVRCMAEFVGREGKYSSMFGSVIVIYKDDGIFGFFAGVIPRLMCDIGALWLSNAVIHFLHTYVIEDSDLKSYIAAAVRFLSSAIWYPLHVVSNCMAVTNSGLAAGSPPLMPHYNNWTDCYSHLRSINSLKRGSTLLWRTYTGSAVLNHAGIPVIPDHALFVKPQKY